MGAPKARQSIFPKPWKYGFTVLLRSLEECTSFKVMRAQASCCGANAFSSTASILGMGATE